MMPNSSRFILGVRCDQSFYPTTLGVGLLLESFVGTIGDGVVDVFDSSCEIRFFVVDLLVVLWASFGFFKLALRV
jgi:hypothetical protein